VRDLLLKSEPRDFDFIIDHDLKNIVDDLSAKLKANRVHYSQFKTSTITIDGLKFDFARARTETYERPGALPNVHEASVDRDLWRRDFSINSLALELTDPNNPSLLDPTGGLGDIENKVVRILHSRSFLDDPTRILRAIRYEQRLKFSINIDTQSLLLKAVKNRALATISGDRIRNEIDLIIDEPERASIFLRASTLGVLSSLHSSISPRNWVKTLEKSGEDKLTYISTIAYKLSSADTNSLISLINAPKDWAKVLKDMSYLSQKETLLNEPSLEPVKLYLMLKNRSIHSLNAFKYSTNLKHTRKNICLYLEMYRHIHPSISNDSLKSLGIFEGPDMKIVFEQILSGRLNGTISTLPEEIEIARSYLKLQKRK
jgi:tRNA nucleotidyltransferase (CCA-adding enzyme)